MDPLAYETKRELIVLENEHAFCIPPKEPMKLGHVMVLPKRNVSRLDEFSPEEARDCLALLEKVRDVLRERFEEDPVILMNAGVHSTQSHLHWHILPSKGGMRDLYHAFEKMPRRVELSSEQLREHVRALRQ